MLSRSLDILILDFLIFIRKKFVVFCLALKVTEVGNYAGRPLPLSLVVHL